MIKYRVSKCRGAYCLCRGAYVANAWHVVRFRGLERALMCSWSGHATALDAALEFAGLAKTPEQPC